MSNIVKLPDIHSLIGSYETVSKKVHDLMIEAGFALSASNHNLTVNWPTLYTISMYCTIEGEIYTVMVCYEQDPIGDTKASFF